MAELDPSIIFRQEKYSGPTQAELDAKQNMNALRNMLGAGQSIDSPEVINAMMARDPDMGLKLMTNANTMQTDAATRQAKQQEARLAELDALLPVGAAIVKNNDQQAWSEFRMHLGQRYPEALNGFPDRVEQGAAALQAYVDARRNLKGGSQALPYQATEMGGYLQRFNRATGQMELVLDNQGRPMPANTITTTGMRGETAKDVANIGAQSREATTAANIAAQNQRQDAKLLSQAGIKGVTGATVTRVGQEPAADLPGVAASEPEAKRLTELRATLPKARASLSATEDKLTSLDADIASLINDPALAKITGDELAQYRGSFPTLFGPGAARAQSKLEAIIAQGVFSELAEIKQQSPTGSALGAVSDKEGALLAAGFGELKQAQKAEDVVTALNKIKASLARSRARLRSTFNEEYGPIINAGAAPAGGAPVDPNDPVGIR